MSGWETVEGGSNWREYGYDIEVNLNGEIVDLRKLVQYIKALEDAHKRSWKGEEHLKCLREKYL